jgi:hypothetical protein
VSLITLTAQYEIKCSEKLAAVNEGSRGIGIGSRSGIELELASMLRLKLRFASLMDGSRPPGHLQCLAKSKRAYPPSGAWQAPPGPGGTWQLSNQAQPGPMTMHYLTYLVST